MRAWLGVTSVGWLLVAACGGSSPTTQAGTTLGNTPGNTNDATDGVHAVDWQNRTYLFDDGGDALASFAVTDGAFVDEPTCTHFWAKAPVFGDLTGDGVDEAVVPVDSKACDSLHYAEIQIYDADERVLGRIAIGETANKAGTVDQLAIVDGGIELTRYVTQDGDDFRSPSLAVHERWTWDPGTSLFVEDVAARTSAPFVDPDA